MARLSTLPFLFIIECLFLLWAARKVGSRFASVVGLITGLSIWAGVSIWLAISGGYDHPQFLDLLPGLWLPLVPIFLVAATFLFKPMRQDLRLIARHTPLHWFVAIQMLRIAALGTLIKTLQGQFPVYVELAVGLTDLSYGFSALLIYGRVKAKKLSQDALMLWNMVGVLLIIIPGMLAIQMGLPGPLNVFRELPTSEVMLDYPMVLGPSLVVPVLLLLNALGAWAAYLQKQSAEAYSGHNWSA